MPSFPVKRQLRRSQAITTFGPGSIVDLREESVMMGGIDFWSSDTINEVHEPNLERALNVTSFRTPATVEQSYTGKDLPYSLFPTWLVCPKCHRLAPSELFSGGIANSEKIARCPDCKKKVHPARLIVACRHGHIDDFPWEEWVKHGTTPCNCARPALELVSSGRTASLGDLIVKCKNNGCGGRRTLAGATEAKNLNFMTCSGKRPWLADTDPCTEKVTPLQRGASNVYFPVSTSVISIPPWSRAIQAELNRYWSSLKFVPDHALGETIKGMNLPDKLGISIDDILAAIQERKSLSAGEGSEKISEADIRKREYLALSKPQNSSNSQDDFKTRPAKIHPSLQPYFSNIVLVDRLREVRALLGFSRINPPDPDPNSRFGATLAPLARSRQDWLPAIEVHGEGIFVEFDIRAVENWVSKNKSLVYPRVQLLNKNYEDLCEKNGWSTTRKISPEFLLAHSFAHSLIRQLSLESGYSSAALRERLYIHNPADLQAGITPYVGLLIYTSSPDSEGSLGGLVRQGDVERFAITVQTAINEATWCSSDPLCIESDGHGTDSLNLSACHACLLLSETCCEEFNRFLDRAMLIGTLNNPEYGFFHNLTEI